MPNGKMLEAIKRYSDAGKPIPDELFKELMVQYAVDSDHARNKLHDVITECKEAIDCLDRTGCEQAGRNLKEIDRLRNRNTINDIITAILVILGTIMSISLVP